MAHPHLEEGRGLEGEWGRDQSNLGNFPLQATQTQTHLWADDCCEWLVWQEYLCFTEVAEKYLVLQHWMSVCKIEKYSEVRLPTGEKGDGWLVAKVQQGALPNWFL